MKARPLAPGRTGHSRPTGVYLLLSALAASVMMSVVIGARPTDLTALMGLLDGRIDSIDEAAIASRLPRTLLALLAGAALAVAGATMQGLTRNPLADPGLLGVNAGAALAVVIGIAWFDMQQASGYLWVAIAGAGASALLVYRAAWTRDVVAERVTREASMAKLYATESAQMVIDEAVQIFGGQGVVSGAAVEKLYREIRALRIYEGASEVQKVVIAKAALAAQKSA